MINKILRLALIVYLFFALPGLMAGCMHWGISKAESKIVHSIEDKETRQLVRRGSSATKSGLRWVMRLRQQATSAITNAILP